jgi:hypothetical protein
MSWFEPYDLPPEKELFSLKALSIHFFTHWRSKACFGQKRKPWTDEHEFITALRPRDVGGSILLWKGGNGSVWVFVHFWGRQVMRDLDLPGLRMRLLRGGVAPKHVKRTLKELMHHFADLEQKALSEGLSQSDAAAQAAEQLGDPKLIIEEALARPELRSWAYRWPWGIYGIFPVVLLALFVVGSILAVVSVLDVAESSSALSAEDFANAMFDQWWPQALLETWRVAMVYVLPAIFAGGLCVFAANRDAPTLWPAVGVFLTLFLGFSYDLTVIPPQAPDQLAEFGAAIGIGTDRFVSIRVLRLLIPLVLVLGPYYWWRRRQSAAFWV